MIYRYLKSAVKKWRHFRKMPTKGGAIIKKCKQKVEANLKLKFIEFFCGEKSAVKKCRHK